jgi:hypothetical protein
MNVSGSKVGPHYAGGSRTHGIELERGPHKGRLIAPRLGGPDAEEYSALVSCIWDAQVCPHGPSSWLDRTYLPVCLPVSACVPAPAGICPRCLPMLPACAALPCLPV